MKFHCISSRERIRTSTKTLPKVMFSFVYLLQCKWTLYEIHCPQKHSDWTIQIFNSFTFIQNRKWEMLFSFACYHCYANNIWRKNEYNNNNEAINEIIFSSLLFAPIECSLYEIHYPHKLIEWAIRMRKCREKRRNIELRACVHSSL